MNTPSFFLESYQPLLLQQNICFQTRHLDQTVLSETHLILLDLRLVMMRNRIVLYQPPLLQVLIFSIELMSQQVLVNLLLLNVLNSFIFIFFYLLLYKQFSFCFYILCNSINNYSWYLFCLLKNDMKNSKCDFHYMEVHQINWKH